MTDADAPNAAQFESWNGQSGTRWVARADERDDVLAPVGAALLTTAAPSPGANVLDIGCGCGATTLAAAAQVGPTGSVSGVDLSEPMLGVARQRARNLDVTNVDFTQADAQTHPFEPGSVDLVLSRFGTMFFDDAVAAFTNVAHALRPPGRLCLASWRPLADNEWLMAPAAVLLEHTELPAVATEGPGMFAQAEPAVVAEVLSAAGFAEVALDPLDVSFALGPSPQAAAEYLADTGPGRLLLESIPAGGARDAAFADLTARLARQSRNGEVRLGGAVWLISARLA
jgi:SAM-dependent methyltransferase